MTKPALVLKNLVVDYPTPSGALRAVNSVSLDVAEGATLGLVGESGSGKSTLARAIAGLISPSSGKVSFRNSNGNQRVQMIFQNPFSSLNPRMSVGESLAEAIVAADGGRIRSKRTMARAAELLDLVSLDEEVASRSPSELSGGQRQRVAIARAIGAEPSIILADEVTSALDVSVQGSILNLLKGLQKQLNLTLLFISHDLAVVRYMSNQVAVMYCGEIVEIAEAEDITQSPKHPYTRGLIESIPRVAPPSEYYREWMPAGDTADPLSPPTGCFYHPRCPFALRQEKEECISVHPELRTLEAGDIRCHFAELM